MSKRVSNKPSQTGARVRRTWNTHRAKISARVARARAERIQAAAIRAEHFNKHLNEQRAAQKPEGFVSRVRRFVRRVFA